MKTARFVLALLALSLIAPWQSAKAADVICYNCPPEWADWASMLKAIKTDLNYDIPHDNKNSGQALCDIDVNHTIEEAIKMARRACVLDEVKIQTDFSALPQLQGNPDELLQVFVNLVTNAVQAMEGQGTLTVSTSSVNGSVRATVKDDGPGIPQHLLGKIFDPFFTTKDVGKGTGLGLSMVYGVARQSGGTARIDSTPGEGTTVKLYFRRAEGDALASAEQGAAVAAASAHGNASILVIDDDPDVRHFIVASLAEHGHRVREASDGVSGLAMFERERPDLVIIDFIMPGLSGADVARHILALAPGQPMLFVSGYSETEAISRAAPGAPLLTKPFRADALATAVREVLAAVRRGYEETAEDVVDAGYDIGESRSSFLHRYLRGWWLQYLIETAPSTGGRPGGRPSSVLRPAGGPPCQL